MVNGKRFFVFGVGCQQAHGEKGEDYLEMAHAMGANAVRTWGDAPLSYLDQAKKNNLMVDLGIWLDPIRETGGKESYQDAEFRQNLMHKILEYVHAMKDHPALLLWNIGNEALAYTEDPKEKAALGHFLEQVIKNVHEEDPNHPVVYSCSIDRDLPDVEKYLPSLDIVGTNVYGTISTVFNWMHNEGNKKPLLVTEFGPLGSWSCAKDKNKIPYDPMDHLKSVEYASLWRQIISAHDVALGGFAFVLGDQRNQDSLTWYNINYGDLKRDAFWTLYKAYTRKKPSNRPPKFSGIELSKSTALKAGQEIEVTVTATDPDRDTIHYDYFIASIASDPLVVEPAKFYPAEINVLGPGHARLTVPTEPGNYRVYVEATDGHKNVAIINHSIQVAN